MLAVSAMTGDDLAGSSSLEDLMERARRRSLLDDWDLKENVVRLTVGTYEIELCRQAAVRFVRSLLKNYEAALQRARN
jgi:hypothetical protein